MKQMSENPKSSMIMSGDDVFENAILTRFEKLPASIFENSDEASKAVAGQIANLINEKNQRGEFCVLGLATGSTPVGVYQELVRLHKTENLSFKKVITFNLDEYYPIQPDALQSYVRFMKEHLFDHIDIDPENINIPDGTLSKGEILSFCQRYEAKIQACGGLDIQVLGIGRTGHIGFNEPGSQINSTTRLITLDNLTRTDASGDFGGKENVPRMAITMGVGTIMNSRKILLMAWGENKASIIAKTVEGEISDQIPATFLQNHPNVQVVLDRAASDELTRVKTPWLLGPCKWNDRLIRKAVVWLCQKLDKPILKLTTRDYNDNGMSDLVAVHGPVYDINIKVFNDLQHTITGWPGGKPNADDTHRPERALPAQKKVLVFSPHPDDDMICMGGTLMRLVDQNHHVHVAYQTSGSISVPDEDVMRFVDFVYDYQGTDCSEQTKEQINQVRDFISAKKSGDVDIPSVQKVRKMIRRGEAKAACRYVGITLSKIHFLEMPFYETGKVKKKPLSKQDIQIIIDLLKEVQPHQIYAAGDLSDPHGTHRVCWNAVRMALLKLKDEPWMKNCYVWLFRGAWQEWDIHQVDMAVPLSPEELMRKRMAIFKHQSQKDQALYPGNDPREFWQRAEDRNHATARSYDSLGMAEYEAFEAFVRYLPTDKSN